MWIRSALLVLSSIVFVLMGSAALAQPFDPVPTILRAPEILAADLLEGEHHQVMERVENDGFMNRYQIASDFGRFEAYGTLQLALRVQEIGALAELDKLTKTEVFADAAQQSARSGVDAVGQFVEEPVETVKRIPSGAKRMLKVARRRTAELKENAEERREERREESAEEGEGEGAEDDNGAAELADDTADAGAYLIKRYFGVTAAERRWAQKLGVDPYTSNDVLRKEIKKVARVDSAGRFGVKLLPIPRIPGVSAIKTVNKVAWSKDPYELQDFNRERLRSIGVEEATIAAFFEVPWISPSGQTILITNLVGLEGAENRQLAIEQVLDLESLDEGRFFVQASEMLAWLHENEAPVVRLLRGVRTLVGLTSDKREIVPAPVDHLQWTPELVELAEGRAPELDVPGLRSRELWLIRNASELCHERLETRGWRIETELGERMQDQPATRER